MMKHSATLLLGLSVLLAWLCPAPAQPASPWSRKKLERRATLIVIGTVRSTGDLKGFAENTRSTEITVPVETLFNVQAVLKGQYKGKTLTVRHARLSRFANDILHHKSGVADSLVDAPDVITFDPRGMPRYVMYLRRRLDGFYEPVSGQSDPGFSFFRLRPF